MTIITRRDGAKFKLISIKENEMERKSPLESIKGIQTNITMDEIYTIFSSYIAYMILCSKSILLDQYPFKLAFNGSGFPIPSRGFRSMSFIKEFIRLSYFLSVFIQY
jgi:hypothetical protein